MSIAAPVYPVPARWTRGAVPSDTEPLIVGCRLSPEAAGGSEQTLLISSGGRSRSALPRRPGTPTRVAGVAASSASALRRPPGARILAFDREPEYRAGTAPRSCIGRALPPSSRFRPVGDGCPWISAPNSSAAASTRRRGTKLVLPRRAATRRVKARCRRRRWDPRAAETIQPSRAADEQQDPGKVPVGRRRIGRHPLGEVGEGGDEEADDCADEGARDEHRQDATSHGDDADEPRRA